MFEQSTEGTEAGLTRNNVTGIHGILVFDESEAIHELDLGDLSGAMSVEVGLDISLGGWERSVMFLDNNKLGSVKSQRIMRQIFLTISRKIAQV